MFWKKRKNEQGKVINEVFGEMEQGIAGWYVRTQITLWNKTFDIDLQAVQNTKTTKITPKQEYACKYFKENKVDIQKKIEKLIEGDCKTKDVNVLLSRFEPYNLMFNLNGGCALLLYDSYTDDEDEFSHEDLAVTILPKFGLMSDVSYEEYAIIDEYVDD